MLIQALLATGCGAVLGAFLRYLFGVWFLLIVLAAGVAERRGK